MKFLHLALILLMALSAFVSAAPGVKKRPSRRRLHIWYVPVHYGSPYYHHAVPYRSPFLSHHSGYHAPVVHKVTHQHHTIHHHDSGEYDSFESSAEFSHEDNDFSHEHRQVEQEAVEVEEAEAVETVDEAEV